MTHSFRRFRSLNADDRSLVLEAAITTIFVRLGISTIRFTALRDALDRWARAFALPSSRGAREDVKRVGWSVAAVTRRLPFDSTCLIQSLAVDAMLRRRGVPCEIRVGVRPPGGATLTAHAWVEHDGEVVFGARADLSEYRVLARQGAS